MGCYQFGTAIGTCHTSILLHSLSRFRDFLSCASVCGAVARPPAADVGLVLPILLPTRSGRVTLPQALVHERNLEVSQQRDNAGIGDGLKAGEFGELRNLAQAQEPASHLHRSCIDSRAVSWRASL
jgi:hypothetical protein